MKSMYLSLVALIVAALALINSFCGFRDSNLIISFLGVLVTLLVGWNIIQFIYAKDEIRRISKEESDRASREATQKVRSDLKHILDALSPLINARVDTVFGDSARAIHFYFISLEEYLSIEDSILYQEYVSAHLEEILSRIEIWKQENKCLILREHLSSYLAVLDTFDNPRKEELKEYLLNAEEDKGGPHTFSHVNTL